MGVWPVLTVKQIFQCIDALVNVQWDMLSQNFHHIMPEFYDKGGGWEIACECFVTWEGIAPEHWVTQMHLDKAGETDPYV